MAIINSSAMQAAFFAALAEPFTGEALFDRFTDMVFFIKNARGEYVVVNQEMVARCGRREKSELIGRTADQVYPRPLGQSYRVQDQAVLRTGQPIYDQLELQLYHGGGTGWCMTNKLPLRGKNGVVIGLVGISKDLQSPNERGEDYARIGQAIQHIHAHYEEPLRVATLAAQNGLSPYQLDHRIRKIFHLTTGQFIHKVRMDAAVRRLQESEDAVAQVALDCGYGDQSAFTRKFRQTVGLTPSQFRRAARASARNL